MAGMRVVAAACAVLAAAPAAGQDSGAAPERFDAMAQAVVAMLNEEAERLGARPRVTFRPASTGSEGVRVYCDALSFGLRNALHRRVEALRDKWRITTFDVAVANARAVEPPDVTISWSWDGAGSVRVEARVLLEDGRFRQVPKVAVLDAAALPGPERACLFSFRADERMVTAKAAGMLREDPTFDPRRIVRPYSAGEEFLVQGVLAGAGRDDGVWSVVAGKDSETGEWRNLFAMGLAVDDDDDDAAFESARRANTAAAFEGYLESFPSGRHADEARRLRDAALAADRDAFESARRANTVAAFDGYLSSFPSGRHVAEARRLRKALDDPFPVGHVFRDCDHCPEMVVVPAGRFEMGSPASESGRNGDEGPQHEVTIGANFAVGVYEVTFDEWGACVSNGGCGGYRPADQGWGKGGRPVINVSWDDAQAYASWLSRETGEEYRLLSEAEWEYVARAGTVTRYWWGDGIGANRANCNDGCGDGYANTAPVGSFDANAFGLHDVHGNVWEWVEDCWHENYARAPSNGDAWLGGRGGDCSRRVLRGGSWNYNPRILRSALRGWNDAGGRYYGNGFRVARTFTP